MAFSNGSTGASRATSREGLRRDRAARDLEPRRLEDDDRGAAPLSPRRIGGYVRGGRGASVQGLDFGRGDGGRGGGVFLGVGGGGEAVRSEQGSRAHRQGHPHHAR